jgi:hypothetical protein
VSWIDRIVEQRIAEAIARGELDTPELRGASLDLDRQRNDGWWAEQLVRKERSRILREDSLPELATRRAAFWRAPTVPAMLELVADANKWIVGVNQRLLPADAMELFDPHEAVETWKTLRPAR